MGVLAHYRCRKSIDARISRDVNTRLLFSLEKKVSLRRLRRSKIVMRDHVHGLAIKLLWKWRCEIVRAQTRLDMANGNLKIKSRKCSSKTCGCIAMH